MRADMTFDKVSVFPLKRDAEEPPAATARGKIDLAAPERSVRSQNCRQKLFFVLGTIILTVLIAGGARYFLHSTRPLRIAAGPTGTVEYRLAEKLADVVAANSTDLRLRLIADDSPAAAAARFTRGEADLGFVRTDQKVPSTARSLALIEHFVFLLISPKGSKITALNDLKGKKVALITSESGADALFRAILEASQVEAARVTLTLVPGDTPVEGLFGRDQYQAGVMFVSLSTLAATKRFDRLSKIEVHDIDASKALERKVAGTTTETVEAGLLSSSPKIPDEDLETAGVQEFVTVRRGLSNTVVSELAGILLESKSALAIDRTFAARIEPPDTDKDAFIVAHPGVPEYTDNEVKSFLDRYSDLFYMGTSVAGILGSLSAAIYTAITRVKPLDPSAYTDQILAIDDSIADATSLQELDNAEEELDIVLRQVLIGLKHGNVSTSGLDGFRLAFEHAHSIIAGKRRRLSEAAPGARVNEA
ncbi:MAG: TAXI family TRAP transporter solute-binding subunit [Beijerinckiaceae bacterium]